jgi:oligoendopeptidase F
VSHAAAPPLAPYARRFVPTSLSGESWPPIQAIYDELLSRPLTTLEALVAWIADADELHRVLQEDLGWRYIRMTRNTQDEAAVAAYRSFVEQISPQVAPLDHTLNERFVASKHRAAFEALGSAERLYSRRVSAAIEIFRQENVALQSQIDVKAQGYGALSAAQTIDYDSKTLTLQQTAPYLERTDRAEREQVWRLVAARREADRSTLDTLFDELRDLRVQMAQNAGFASFTDFRYAELARFDYGRAECEAFCEAIATSLTPLYTELNAVRQRRLGLDSLRPWDLSVDPFGETPLHPFATDAELISRTEGIYDRLSPELGSLVRTLSTMGHLDLGSRIGKAPGGYNYPLLETGVPFIFMNAVGTQSDLTTMVHEVGHAIHSLTIRDLPLAAYQDCPSEVAELASMSSELITMDYWDAFYSDTADLRRAQLNQILRTLTILPWIATVDRFQTWVYDHPKHTAAERADKFAELHTHFFGYSVDWSGLEPERAYQWHRQLHIFELPFYYIEYGIAQLGALQVWRAVKQDPDQGLADYLAALRLGYTQPIPEIYARAGARFDFSAEMLDQLVSFVRGELDQLGYFAN